MAGTLVALVAAHNEEASIRATLLSLLRQERRADRIVVAVENCADGTLAIARSVPGVTVFETEANRAKNRVADGPRRGPVEVRFNRLTRFDWWQQLHGVLAVLIRSAWIVLLVAGVVMGTLQLQPLCWSLPPVPRQRREAVVPGSPTARRPTWSWRHCSCPRSSSPSCRRGDSLMAWSRVMAEKVGGVKPRDRWALQAEAEVKRRGAGASVAATRT